MKIFLAGATGAAGQALIPLLTSHGHTVIGTTRSESKTDLLRGLGAEPVVVDGLDRDGIRAAVATTRPDAIIHEMTALGGDLDLRRFERSFAATNRLRTEGTDHLLEAARATGVEHFIAQSYGAWPYSREGGPVKTEDDPLDPTPVPAMRESFAAMRYLDETVGVEVGRAPREHQQTAVVGEPPELGQGRVLPMPGRRPAPPRSRGARPRARSAHRPAARARRRVRRTSGAI